MKRTAWFLVTVSTLVALALPAWAHEGEDHSDRDEPAAPAATAPRAVTATESFELVAVAGPTGLTVYLNDFATNAPVAGALVAIGSGALQANAHPLAAGVYQVQTDHFANPGSYPMTIAIETGDAADLMTAVLEVPPPQDGAARVRGRSPWQRSAVLGASGALLLAGVGLVAVRGRAVAADKNDAPK